MEGKAAVTRRQVGGVRGRAATSGWAAATFVHRSSRAGDPQLHSHCVIANLVCRDDGAWVALDATALYGRAKAAGSVYQEELRRRLTVRLGLGWGPDRNGCREMTGISEAQLRAFSKRTVQIEAHLADTGAGALPDRKARMRADEAASVATRPAKDRSLTADVLRDRWTDEAETVGLPTGDALLPLVQDGSEARVVGSAEVLELFDRLVDPEVGLCAHDSHFGEAQVVAAVAAWGAGRLDVAAIETLTGSFLDSKRVVRLVNPDTNGRAPGQWSTVVHRRVEDRVLDHLAVLQQQPAPACNPTAIEAAITAAGILGDDQATAVRVLCGQGPALRALTSPAGHGKTTTIATAVDALRRSGRPVLALSTTNQAVDQLRQVGINACTVARFALDNQPLEAGAVIVVDEFSQLPTVEADMVLAAVAACADGQVWMVGDPLQAQPVRSGGLAAWIAEQARLGQVMVAELTVNRRQVDPVERHALTVFRHGHVVESQELRDGAGWEHHHADRDHALDAMAAAVLADLHSHGADRVAALAVTHADCEALADRIRTTLAADGFIGGPALEGPGWAGPRHYQSGDRILLHAHAEVDDGRRLTNGSVANVVAVNDQGLLIRADCTGQAVLLPAGFVTGRGADGRPQVSHAWARTVDGVQGGTWAQAHLLATPAIDGHRGYVGQSRSIAPTHTWNTTPEGHPDHDYGGRIVKTRSTPAELIAAALARSQPKTFAAPLDPYRIDSQLRAERAVHRRHLDTRPPDVSDRIDQAQAVVDARQRDLADAQAQLRQWEERRDATAGLRGFSAARRHQHRQATSWLTDGAGIVVGAEHAFDRAVGAHADLVAGQACRDVFDAANQWRHERIAALGRQLAETWTVAVLGAARDGHPHAYGADHLRAARQQLIGQIEHLGQSDPPGRRGADPLRALADLDRAVREHPAPTPARPARPVTPPRPTPSRGRWRMEPFPQQQWSPEPPSKSPSIGL